MTKTVVYEKFEEVIIKSQQSWFLEMLFLFASYTSSMFSRSLYYFFTSLCNIQYFI